MRRFPLAPAAVVFALLVHGMPAAAADPKPTSVAVPAPPPSPNIELRQGHEAYAHGDYANAATHLARAAAGFQVTGDRESLAAAYLELGRVQLVGLGEPEKALAAFLKSAGVAARPAGALEWAATAADKLGLPAEARRYRERAQERAAAKAAASAADARSAAAPAADASSPAVPAADAPAKSPAPRKPSHYKDREMATAPPAPAADPAATHPAPAAPEDHPEMTTFYLVLLRRGPGWKPDQSPAIQRLQEAHMANIRRLAGEGKLVIAGPFLDEPGPGTIAGLYIFRAPSLDAVKELAATDPMVRSGRLVPEIHPWLGPKGLHY